MALLGGPVQAIRQAEDVFQLALRKQNTSGKASLRAQNTSKGVHLESLLTSSFGLMLRHFQLQVPACESVEPIDSLIAAVCTRLKRLDTGVRCTERTLLRLADRTELLRDSRPVLLVRLCLIRPCASSGASSGASSDSSLSLTEASDSTQKTPATLWRSERRRRARR